MQGIPLLENEKVSWFQSYEVLNFQSFKISTFKSFKITKCQSSKISVFQIFKIPKTTSKVSKGGGHLIQTIENEIKIRPKIYAKSIQIS